MLIPKGSAQTSVRFSRRARSVGLPGIVEVSDEKPDGRGRHEPRIKQVGVEVEGKPEAQLHHDDRDHQVVEPERDEPIDVPLDEGLHAVLRVAGPLRTHQEAAMPAAIVTRKT